MKTKIVILAVVFTGLLMGCASTGSSWNEDHSDVLEKMVDQMAFTVESDYLKTATIFGGTLPNGSGPGQINLNGINNFLNFDGKNRVYADLPYWGQRRLSAPMDPSDNGIKFDGPPEDMVVEKVSRTGAYKFRFNVRGSGETYRVILEVKKNLKTVMTVNSPQLQTIWFYGDAKMVGTEDTASGQP